jgi:16S rRNA (cytidine1402-2'-O)-methyltransferase
LKSDGRTLIFYESPRRLLAALEDAVLIFGEQRQACLARELTKLHETIETRPLVELIDWVKADDNQQRGECVLLIEGSQNEATADEQEVSRLLKILLTELPVKKAAAMVANITGGSKNEAYQLALKLQQKN